MQNLEVTLGRFVESFFFFLLWFICVFFFSGLFGSRLSTRWAPDPVISGGTFVGPLEVGYNPPQANPVILGHLQGLQPYLELDPGPTL